MKHMIGWITLLRGNSGKKQGGITTLVLQVKVTFIRMIIEAIDPIIMIRKRMINSRDISVNSF